MREKRSGGLGNRHQPGFQFVLPSFHAAKLRDLARRFDLSQGGRKPRQLRPTFVDARRFKHLSSSLNEIWSGGKKPAFARDLPVAVCKLIHRGLTFLTHPTLEEIFTWLTEIWNSMPTIKSHS